MEERRSRGGSARCSSTLKVTCSRRWSTRPTSTTAEPFLGAAAQAFPSIRHLWADTAYQGLKTWLPTTLGWTLTVTKHWWTGRSGFWVAPGQQPPQIPAGFHVMPRRWVVERSFAWFGRNRRLSKDYERYQETGELLLYLAMSRVSLRRLTAKRAI